MKREPCLFPRVPMDPDLLKKNFVPTRKNLAVKIFFVEGLSCSNAVQGSIIVPLHKCPLAVRPKRKKRNYDYNFSGCGREVFVCAPFWLQYPLSLLGWSHNLGLEEIGMYIHESVISMIYFYCSYWLQLWEVCNIVREESVGNIDLMSRRGELSEHWLVAVSFAESSVDDFMPTADGVKLKGITFRETGLIIMLSVYSDVCCFLE